MICTTNVHYLRPCSVHLAACYYPDNVVIWVQRNEGNPHRIQNAEDTDMKYEVTINNYQKGAQLKTAMPLM